MLTLNNNLRQTYQFEKPVIRSVSAIAQDNKPFVDMSYAGDDSKRQILIFLQAGCFE